MILEVALLNVIPGKEKDFESDFKEAEQYISSISGYEGHSLRNCIEDRSKYLLLVNWKTIENHTIDFRGSEHYLAWKKLLHHYYNPFPVVEYYELVP